MIKLINKPWTFITDPKINNIIIEIQMNMKI